MKKEKPHTKYVEEFIIHYAGDPSVGIFPGTWNIKGGFFFEDRSELEEFRKKLSEAWEYCSDTPVIIMTLKEQQEYLKQEEEQSKELSKLLNEND